LGGIAKKKAKCKKKMKNFFPFFLFSGEHFSLKLLRKVLRRKRICAEKKSEKTEKLLY
jgi:hypothetical protein